MSLTHKGHARARRFTVADYLRWWLETVAKPYYRFATWRYYRGLAFNHVIPLIGGVRLERLAPEDIEEMLPLIGDTRGTETSARLRQQIYDFMRKVLDRAVRRGFLTHNVCYALDRPRVPRSEMCPLDERQAKAMLATARGDRFYALYLLVLNTGMRLGEVTGLRWKDVDLENGMVSLQRSLIIARVVGEDGVARERPMLAETKSRLGRRIPISGFVVAELREHKTRMLAEGHVEFIFCDLLGNPMRQSNFTRRNFKPLLKKTDELLPIEAKLPVRFRFHDLRHTHATLLMKAGVHPKVVSERLGHASIAITLDLYSHVVPSIRTERLAGR